MYLITPSQFLSRYPEGQSIIFVGNAPSLKGERLGKWIDSHDLVIRFNESPIVGYEDDVGLRTDILVTNPYPENRRPFALTNGGVVIVISPQTRRLPSPQFESWVGNNSVLFTFPPDIVQVGDIEHTASLTTGVYGLHLLSRLLRPAHVSVTGFTMFLNHTSHHYWQSDIPTGLHAHDVIIEASILISICNSLRCKLVVTDDVSWVARRVNKSLSGNVNIKPLTDSKWKS